MPIQTKADPERPGRKGTGRGWMLLALLPFLLLALSLLVPLELRVGPVCGFAAPIHRFLAPEPSNLQCTWVPLPQGARLQPTLVWHNPVGWVHKPHGLPVSFFYARIGNYAYRIGCSWVR